MYVVSPLLYQPCEVLWPLAVEVHLLSCLRMHKSESLGMQSLTRTDGKTIVDKGFVLR